jgi:hypothetical protein
VKLVHLVGFIIKKSCIVFVFTCTVVVLNCFVMYGCVCMCGFCNVCVLVMCILAPLATLTEIFPCFFLICKANARVKLAKTRQGQHSSQLVVICVVLCIVCV